MSGGERPTSSGPGASARPAEPRVWLYRPSSVGVLWRIAAVILLLTVLAELVVHLHPAFAVDAWFGFNAVYGFLSCVAMVLFARVLGWLVKRPDDYYTRHGAPEDHHQSGQDERE